MGLQHSVDLKYSLLNKEKGTWEINIDEKKTVYVEMLEDALDVLDYNTKIRHYRDGFRKITYCSERIFTLGKRRVFNWWDFIDEETKRVKEHKRKRNDSIRRARERIYDFVLLNDFDYFVTITFDKTKVNRENTDLIKKKLSRWLKNQVQRKGLKFILIPEYHKKDNSIHAHALISGNLNYVDSGTRICRGYDKPLKLSTIERKGISEDDILHTVYNITDWKYGFSTAIQCYGDVLRRANYIVKYITKDLNKIFGRYFWHSQNLVSDPTVEYANLEYGGFYGLDLPEYKSNYSNNRFKYETNIGFLKGMGKDEN